MEYIFTLRFQLSDARTDVNALIDRLADAGCDDALVGVGLPGRLALEFTREAPSARHAMHSALKNVGTAAPGALLIEASPDMVGLTDVARVIGVSRQNVRKLMLTHAASFPSPMHDGATALWHLADVLDWLNRKGGYTVEPTLVEIAREAMALNAEQLQRHVKATAPRS